MNEFQEAIKGFTDLPIAVVALIFSVMLKRKGKESFAELFGLTALSAVAGALVHIFKFTSTAKNLIWIGLYLALFEAIRRFAYLMSNYIKAEQKPEKIFFYSLEGVLYLLAVVLMLFAGKFDMACLLVFGAVNVLRILISAVKSKRMPLKVVMLLVFAVFGIAFQFSSGTLPFAVVYEHALIFAMLFTVYLIAKE